MRSSPRYFASRMDSQSASIGSAGGASGSAPAQLGEPGRMAQQQARQEAARAQDAGEGGAARDIQARSAGLARAARELRETVRAEARTRGLQQRRRPQRERVRQVRIAGRLEKGGDGRIGIGLTHRAQRLGVASVPSQVVDEAVGEGVHRTARVTAFPTASLGPMNSARLRLAARFACPMNSARLGSLRASLAAPAG